MLETLGFDNDALETVIPILNLSALPLLRTLSMLAIDHAKYLEQLSNSGLAALIPQLEVLSLDSQLIDIAPEYLLSAFDHSLFDYYSIDAENFTTWVRQIRHLRLMTGTAATGAVRSEMFSILATSLRDQAKVRLQSLYFNISLKDSGQLRDSAKKDKVSEAVTGLAEACRYKGIEVIYEDQPNRWVDSYTSREFSTRQRRVGVKT